MITSEDYQDYLELIAQDYSQRKACEILSIAPSTMRDYIKRLQKEKDSPIASLSESVPYVDSKTGRKLNVLYFDLETSLMRCLAFRTFKENVPPHRILKHSHLLTVSWAFNDEEVEGVRITPLDVATGNDLEIVVKVIEAINKSDIIVTFNGKRFDWGVLAARALYWGLPPIKKVPHIDLFQDAKKFRLPSRSMQAISMYLGLDGKIATGGSKLWERCDNHENPKVCEEALEEMLTYNKQDIEATRDLHKRLQGWGSTVNVGTVVNTINDSDELRCSHCGSTDINIMDGKAITAASSFQLYRCGESDCRGISRITAKGNRLTYVSG